ncbi:MAG: 7-cyano-7-deazaguanine synthase [Patescibacteria group bacterium]
MKQLEQVIPKVSQADFWRRLATRQYENIDLIKTIEAFFKEKRGYVFKMPRPGTAVILLISGGLDSTIICEVLLKYYHLKVYPLFLHQGRTRTIRQKEALSFFADLWQRRYPKLFIPPREFSTKFPPPEIEKSISDTLNYLSPQRILESLDLQSAMVNPLSAYGLGYVYPFLASLYATYLFDHSYLKIRTIFNAVTVGDGTVVPGQSFTALRATLLLLCAATGDYNWQFASPALEKEIGHWWEKSDLIKLGQGLKLPLEKTWSCYRGGKYQCGDRCLTCLSRRTEFQKAGVRDKTVYLSGFYSLGEVVRRKILTKFFPFAYTWYRRSHKKRG